MIDTDIDDNIFELLDYKTNNDIQDDNICINCNTYEYLVENYSEGIIVCTNCGTVKSEIMDETAEWRNYEDSTKGSASRCSKISYNGANNSIGTSIACSSSSRLGVLHKWSLAQYKEKTLNDVFELIKEKCRLGSILKCIEDDAKILYKNISDIKVNTDTKLNKKIITRGKNRTSLIAACLFFACKRKACTRSPKEIAGLFRLKDTEVTKGCKTFVKLKNKIDIQCDLEPSIPEHFITRFCKDLNVSDYTEDALTIVKNIQKLNIGSSHTPLSIATASILLMSNYYELNITKKIIASKFPVSEVTISKAYHEISIYKNILLNNGLSNRIVVFLNNIKKYAKKPKQLEDRYKFILKQDKSLKLDGHSEKFTDKYTNIETDDQIDDKSDYAINSINLIDKLNRLSFKMHEQIYTTNTLYYMFMPNCYELINHV